MAEYIINTDMIPVEIPDKSEVVTFFGEAVKELIRCGECRFWPEAFWNAASLDLNEMHTSYVRCFHMGPDDFCSKAKRRE